MIRKVLMKSSFLCRTLNNKQGFGLIEVAITGAILLVVAVAVGGYVIYFNRQSESIKGSSAYKMLVNDRTLAGSELGALQSAVLQGLQGVPDVAQAMVSISGSTIDLGSIPLECPLGNLNTALFTITNSGDAVASDFLFEFIAEPSSVADCFMISPTSSIAASGATLFPGSSAPLNVVLSASTSTSAHLCAAKIKMTYNDGTQNVISTTTSEVVSGEITALQTADFNVAPTPINFSVASLGPQTIMLTNTTTSPATAISITTTITAPIPAQESNYTVTCNPITIPASGTSTCFVNNNTVPVVVSSGQYTVNLLARVDTGSLCGVIGDPNTVSVQINVTP
jgi:hypothetical protein